MVGYHSPVVIFHRQVRNLQGFHQCAVVNVAVWGGEVSDEADRWLCFILGPWAQRLRLLGAHVALGKQPPCSSFGDSVVQADQLLLATGLAARL